MQTRTGLRRRFIALAYGGSLLLVSALPLPLSAADVFFQHALQQPSWFGDVLKQPVVTDDFRSGFALWAEDRHEQALIVWDAWLQQGTGDEQRRHRLQLAEFLFLEHAQEPARKHLDTLLKRDDDWGDAARDLLVRYPDPGPSEAQPDVIKDALAQRMARSTLGLLTAAGRKVRDKSSSLYKTWLQPHDFTVSGYVRNETAYRYRKPRSFTKIRNTLNLETNLSLGEMMAVKVGGWAYHDSVYDFFDYDTVAARSTRDVDQPLVFIEQLARQEDSDVAQLREAYLDITLDNADIRLGKQWVIWGVLDGIRVVDEINPFDFRELILPDLLDFRIPLWTAKVDYYLDNGDALELLWIPEVRFHKPAPPGSEFELLQEVPNTIRPKGWKRKNDEWGLRWSGERLDTELTLSYFYTWDDFPVVFRRVKLDQTEDPIFFPTFMRMQMYGGTFVKQIGPRILKGEAAFVTGKYFAVANVDRNQDGFLDTLGEVRRSHIRWGLGSDFNKWKTDFSPAITQWVILNYDPSIIQNEYDTSLSLFIRHEIPQLSAVFQMLTIVILSQKEYLLRPKISFKLSDRFTVATGIDLFSGNRSLFGVLFTNGRPVDLISTQERARFFGNFHDNDRIYMELTYAF